MISSSSSVIHGQFSVHNCANMAARITSRDPIVFPGELDEIRINGDLNSTTTTWRREEKRTSRAITLSPTLRRVMIRMINLLSNDCGFPVYFHNVKQQIGRASCRERGENSGV